MDEKKPKKKGSIGRIIGIILLIIVILFVALVAFARYSATKSQREYEAKEKAELHSSLNWPTNTTVAKMLPKPDSDVGRINWEHDDSISVEIPDVSTDDFNNYINKCSDAGFNMDFDKSDTYYFADNADGYRVSLLLDNKNVMSIGLDGSIEKTDDDTDVSTDTSTIEETVAPTEAPAEESSTTETTEVSTDSNSIRPDIKEVIDSYETFMNDYCDFMTKYSESDDVASMMADYADYMSKYTDMAKKFDDLENDNLNDAELSYYLEVQTRITQKLANVPTN